LDAGDPVGRDADDEVIAVGSCAAEEVLVPAVEEVEDADGEADR
jgi:hypothetical protein